MQVQKLFINHNDSELIHGAWQGIPLILFITVINPYYLHIFNVALIC